MTGQKGSPGFWWTPVAGLGFALGALAYGFAAGLDIGAPREPEPGQAGWATLFLGAFAAGCALWWLCVARPQVLSLRRGAVTGALVGLASFPAVTLVAELFRLSAPHLGERLVRALQHAGFGIATFGFSAMLAMAAVGAVLALGLRGAYPAPPPGRPHLVLRAATALVAGLAGLLGGSFVALSLLPLDAAGLERSRAAPQAALSHAEAMAAFAEVQAAEAVQPLNPRCRSLLLSHGRTTRRAVVFFHGFTNCPAQFDELGPELFARGYNVYVPLLPRHGEADQMTLALGGLTAEELVAAADAAIDLGRGLGEEVAVAGLSGGGTMAAWAGQYRPDAGGSLAIAPFLGPHVVPVWANRAATNLLLLLPNLMIPWDAHEPGGPPAMYYAYPRYATHALAQFMRLGEIVRASAGRAEPMAPALGMLLNDADFAVSNAMARRLAAAWEQHGREVDLEVLPLSLQLIHDLIDPRQEEADTGLVYPILIDMIERQFGGMGR